MSDLAFREDLESHLAGDPLVSDQALLQFSYVPTVTRDDFHTKGRIGDLIASGRLFRGLGGQHQFDPETDRVMLCGSMAMIRGLTEQLEQAGLTEGSNAKPGDFVIERAFVG